MLVKSLNRYRRHRRVRQKIEGSLQIPRLVVFRGLSHIHAQIVDDQGNRVLAAASDLKLKKQKQTKSEIAKEVGKLLATAALEKGVRACVFDRNGYQYHGRVQALAEGAREGGLQF
ncbi:50S ribosomal protein L18 [Candidatus Peregrinibacteria bacterium CG08_land_8_20_14_0_20_41_10]|nr:MAG: 50S ribosomal protein L18 [Candidatus Peregrinibacteria bacterium CG1_02_41_10]PIS32211.1 MAG: 50S ribosomal protein L18 [Candidatus Peregrinibacteria bacterium CG08_land_8_20_14_0_20_41_10]